MADEPFPWQALPTPSAHPGTSALRFVLSLVLHLMDGRKEISLPRRDVQLALNRLGGRGVSGAIKKLVAGHWIAVVGGSNLIEPNTYALGSCLTRDRALRAAWLELASRIHGPEGLLVASRVDGAFRRGAISENDALVLGALASAEGTPTAAQLDEFLSPLMSRGSVASGKRRLRSIAVLQTGSLSLAEEWLAHLEAHLVDSGALQQCDVVERNVVRERYDRNVRLSRQADWNRLLLAKGTSCVFGCRNLATTTEHFPPQHWGGFDHDALVWPACRSCNAKWGAWIARVPPPLVPQAGVMVVDTSETPERMARASMEVAHERYMAASVRQDLTDVSAQAGRAFGLWLSVVLGEGEVRIVIDPALVQSGGRRRLVGEEESRAGRTAERKRTVFATGEIRYLSGLER